MARVAFLVCVGFSVYGAMQRLLYCVPAPLNAALCDKAKFFRFLRFRSLSQFIFRFRQIGIVGSNS
ncbi:hypothetical protein CGI28_16830 [Vibrio parahaemolyticus]|nr:hypothetical protein CGI70_22015 [Vibrio parahaemolyticus]TOJ61046.1 hypothetical protein CGI35_16700 [Vibrio parahaemolyticus]TOK13197.1 hypothetical protein CGI28_16830 [Vibrio parahaemolyticus]